MICDFTCIWFCLVANIVTKEHQGKTVWGAAINSSNDY